MTQSPRIPARRGTWLSPRLDGTVCLFGVIPAAIAGKLHNHGATMTQPPKPPQPYQRPSAVLTSQEVNPVWKKIRWLLELSEAEVADALAAAGVPVSKNRVSAWGRSPDHKNYSRLTLDELDQALEALVARARRDDR